MRICMPCFLLLAGCTSAVFQAATSERPVLVGPREGLGTNLRAPAAPGTAIHEELSVNQVILAVLPAPQGRDTSMAGIDKPEGSFREVPGYQERGLVRVSGIDIRAGTFLAAAINAWAAWGTIHAEVLLYDREEATNATPATNSAPTNREAATVGGANPTNTLIPPGDSGTTNGEAAP